MSLVNRLLDTFFRALDAIDAARDRIDKGLGRNEHPQPWSVGLPAAVAPPHATDASAPASVPAPAPASALAPTQAIHQSGDQQEPHGQQAASAREAEAPRGAGTRAGARSPKSAGERPRPGAARKTGRAGDGQGRRASTSAARKLNSGATARTEPAPSKRPTRSKAAPGAQASTTVPARRVTGSSRKGSIDRSGKDVDSPRAKVILETLRARGASVVADDAVHGGKRVLARVLWALHAAEEAGSELGLTAADASALLHLAAGMEVFATNVARTCRDEATLIEETAPDGRSKRYRLTPAGRSAAGGLTTRPWTA